MTTFVKGRHRLGEVNEDIGGSTKKFLLGGGEYRTPIVVATLRSARRGVFWRVEGRALVQVLEGGQLTDLLQRGGEFKGGEDISLLITNPRDRRFSLEVSHLQGNSERR